jgi:hypothetical protein
MFDTTKKIPPRAARTLQAALVLAAAFAATEAMAGVIINYHPANFSTGNANNWSQSVTTPTGDGWDNIVFNYYDPSQNPLAFGTLYLLNQEYLGTPAGLSSLGSGNGLLGTATTTDSQTWQFASGVTLQADTQYWFYTGSTGVAAYNTVSNNGAENMYDGGMGYIANPGFNAVLNGNLDVNFNLQGDPAGATVPEPASLTLFGAIGLAGLAFARRRRKAAQPEA